MPDPTTDRGQQEVFPIAIGATICVIVAFITMSQMLTSIAATHPALNPTPLFHAGALLILLGFVILASILGSASAQPTTTQESDRLEELKTQYVDGELSQLEYENQLHDHWEEELEEVQ